MPLPIRHVFFALVLALSLAGLAWAAARGADAFSAPRPLRVATWNLQWLLSPETAHAARLACRGKRRATVPCDVARTLSRDTADFARLATLVGRLDADVIAFQEVENEAVARRVFRGYRICMGDGAGVQHAGFAVRERWNVRCEPPLQSLSAGGKGREGQLLTLLPPDGAPITLLSVHLKSGCARDAIDSSTPACELLAAQAIALGEWIAERRDADEPFLVLGDLNRGGAITADDPFWSLLNPAAFEAAASRLPFRNCIFGAPYGEFIDHVLVGRALLPRVNHEGFQQMRFTAQEATDFRLSDHCPVSVSLSLSATL